MLISVAQNLPFQKVKHVVHGAPDAQPTPNGGIIILVTGQLKVCQPPVTPLTGSEIRATTNTAGF
jgi:hypothetical protein